MSVAASDPQPATTRLSMALVRRLLTGGLVLGFLILVGVSATTAWLVARDQNYTDWVNHTYNVERRLARFSSDFETAEAARRGFFLTRNQEYLATYRRMMDDLPRLTEQVQALTADNPRQQANIAELDQLLVRKVESLETSIQTVQAGAPPAQVIQQDQQTVDQIRARVAAMELEENRLLAVRTELQGQNAEALLGVVVGSGILLAALAVGSILLVRRYAADLAGSQQALHKLNEGLEQAVRDRTADLSRANEEIQRFAYIVSHDLRSPLVNVMGFTSELEVSLKPLQAMVAQVRDTAPEAVSSDAEVAVTADIPEAIGFIRSSTKKMDRLINAILKLSREGRRTLNPEPLDMGALLQGVAASLRHLADERGARIEVEAPLPSLVSDRLAIEQVFSNLVENALKYLKPGRPGEIIVRGRESGPMLLFEVQDNGRGIDPKDSERIFELFRRSGVQDQPGEGIGLAHVRALAYRLGGHISVESALDQGATFRLSLPRVLSREQESHA